MWSAVTAAMMGLTLGVSGCHLNAGTDAAKEFTEHFTQKFPHDIEKAETSGDNTLPGAGALKAGIIAKPEASDEALEAIQREFEQYVPTVSVSYTRTGLWSNGVVVCPNDGPQEQAKELRRRLRAAHRQFQGRLTCYGPAQSGYAYSGTAQMFGADTTTFHEVAPSGIDINLIPAKEVDGSFTTNGQWGTIPATVGATLEKIDESAVMRQIEIYGPLLKVLVEPQGLGSLRTAAAATAGPALKVVIGHWIRPKSQADSILALAGAADRMHEVGGVRWVSVDSETIKFTATSRTAMLQGLRVGVQIPLGKDAVRVIGQLGSCYPQSLYRDCSTHDTNDGIAVNAATVDAGITIYRRIRDLPTVTQVDMRDTRFQDVPAGATVSVTDPVVKGISAKITTSGSFIDLVRSLKPRVPTGVKLTLTNKDKQCRFRAEPSLTKFDYCDHDIDQRELMAAWDAAPSS
ncbi:hypothetical protein KEM60_02203 [Austwickia sp. TVS 96-490-7B]|nr:hypothetical protein [Austwickia sp. TVS 96-490-7B]